MPGSGSGTYPSLAIVLRTRNLGEKDRLLTLLSAEGKFAAVAKSARSPKSKMAAIAQPFVCARFLVAHGRTLDIAVQAEVETAFPHIAADLLKTAWASYICELCDQVPERQPEAELFELLRLALAGIDCAPDRDRTQLVGHWFEARMLDVLGYTPVIGRCAANGEKDRVPPDSDNRVPFSIALGGTLCDLCATRDPFRMMLSAQALRVVYRLLAATDPRELPDFQLTASAKKDVKDCLRRQLAAHLEKRMKSLTFLDDMTTEPT